MNKVSLTPGTNNVGAYINNINLKSLDVNYVNEIKNILNQYGVIFIKKQNLDPESYQNFAKSIGQPVIYPRLKGLDKKFWKWCSVFRLARNSYWFDSNRRE